MFIYRSRGNLSPTFSLSMLDGEEKIVQEAIQGEASAFGLLYDHYQPMIYRFVILKVGQREEAEDLTHQVFLSAWQNIKNYRNQGFPFSSWLYRIARNQVIDHYRTAKEKIDIEQVDPIFLAVPASMQMGIEQNLEIEKVFKSIKELKPEYQDIIIFRFVEELSLKEVAVLLNKTEGAIKLLQYRAIKKLKELLT